MSEFQNASFSNGISFICSLVLLFCWSPLVTFAATHTEPVMTTEATSSISFDNSLSKADEIDMSSEQIVKPLLTANSSRPVCDHRDPTNPLYPHSSMRFLRTGKYYNVIEQRYDIRDWYQCTLCGYETFFVHGYVY